MELVSGRAVGVGEHNTEYRLESDTSRSILEWYRTNREKWEANVRKVDIDTIVDTAGTEPPILPTTATSREGGTRRFRISKIEAHRFGGLHSYGNPQNPPPNFVFEPKKSITLFEGWNGSGKTSLLNAIVWCLTGQLLRPQRKPEEAKNQFEFRIEQNAGIGLDEPSYHKLTPVTPLPNPGMFLPNAANTGIPIDTWVEITFADQTGFVLPPIRRAQTRTPSGAISEAAPDFSTFGLDPVALHVGTTMPALIPYIQIGSVSELGKAISQLTGLSALVDLSRHAARVRQRLDGEFRKTRQDQINIHDTSFRKARADLDGQNNEHRSIAPQDELPTPSNSDRLEAELAKLEAHYTACKLRALESAKAVLGNDFDPSDHTLRENLEQSIGPARVQLKQMGQLTSAKRLADLSQITEEEHEETAKVLEKIRQEASTLNELAASPDLARRQQLYARVAEWMVEQAYSDVDVCAICGTDLEDVIDPETGLAVKQHIREMLKGDSELIGHTIATWSRARMGQLSSSLPEALYSEVQKDLPAQPVDLISTAICDELFETVPFQGALAALKESTVALCANQLEALPSFNPPKVNEFPAIVAEKGGEIASAIVRLERAVAFSRWRRGNKEEVKHAAEVILGTTRDVGDSISPTSPLDTKLLALEEIVKGTTPINNATDLCTQMSAALQARRKEERRIIDYDRTIVGLDEVIALGGLAERQVEGLKSVLKDRAIHWRERFYNNAYVNSGHDLIDAEIDSKGTIDILVGSTRAAAPAQHISNVSALRASLLGFVLAFWEHVLELRRGLELLLLDDPQELLDDDNRDRLAKSLTEISDLGAQLWVTTHSRLFARMAVSQGQKKHQIEHCSVHPVNATRTRLEVVLSVEELDRKKADFEQHDDDATSAQYYASEARVFIEARLADLFDDPAYPSYSSSTRPPTLSDHLNRLRSLVNSSQGELFRSPIVKEFCSDQALADGALCLSVLNRAHHDKEAITYHEVFDVRDDLKRLRQKVEELHEEFRRWRWREPRPEAQSEVIPLEACSQPSIDVLIHPDLAAFTDTVPVHGSQDVANERFNGSWFDNKALFYLRTDNLGFAAPSGSIVVVECDSQLGRDQNLVIARRGEKTFARRLLRAQENTADLALSAQTPDSRKNPPTLFVDPFEIQVHRIVGVLIDEIPPPASREEAVYVEEAPCLSNIEAVYKVREESALPLALPGQLVLGGRTILSTNLDKYQGRLVAITLTDGSSILKRVGARISGESTPLRQFETIGGLGASEVIATEAVDDDFYDVPTMACARLILGVLYEV